jgi:hypothetical protein
LDDSDTEAEPVKKSMFLTNRVIDISKGISQKDREIF